MDGMEAMDGRVQVTYDLLVGLMFGSAYERSK